MYRICGSVLRLDRVLNFIVHCRVLHIFVSSTAVFLQLFRITGHRTITFFYAKTLWKFSSEKKSWQNMTTNGNIYCSSAKFFLKKMLKFCGNLAWFSWNPRVLWNAVYETLVYRDVISVVGGLCRGYANDFLFGQYVFLTSAEIKNKVLKRKYLCRFENGSKIFAFTVTQRYSGVMTTRHKRKKNTGFPCI